MDDDDGKGDILRIKIIGIDDNAWIEPKTSGTVDEPYVLYTYFPKIPPVTPPIIAPIPKRITNNVAWGVVKCLFWVK